LRGGTQCCAFVAGSQNEMIRHCGGDCSYPLGCNFEASTPGALRLAQPASVPPQAGPLPL
jgi:hypothetical protein